MIYSSIHNDKIKFYKNLNIKKFRDENGLFLVEGEHLVEEASKSGLLKEIIILDGNDYDYNVNKIYVTSNVMKTISTLDSLPSIIGVCDKNLNKVLGDKVLILDNIQDPGNLGTILRTVDSANLKQIVISKETADVFNSKVVRSTMGAIFRVNVVRSDDLVHDLIEMKNNGFKVVVTSLDTNDSVYDVNYMKKVIVIGNEANGVSKEVQEIADYKVKIPMLGKTESLNASVAAGILIYEYIRAKLDLGDVGKK